MISHGSRGPKVEQADEVLTELQALTLILRTLGEMSDTLERIQQQLATINEDDNLEPNGRRY